MKRLSCSSGTSSQIKKSVKSRINYVKHEPAINQKRTKRILISNTNCCFECTINTKSFEYVRDKQKSAAFRSSSQSRGRKKTPMLKINFEDGLKAPEDLNDSFQRLAETVLWLIVISICRLIIWVSTKTLISYSVFLITNAKPEGLVCRRDNEMEAGERAGRSAVNQQDLHWSPTAPLSPAPTLLSPPTLRLLQGHHAVTRLHLTAFYPTNIQIYEQHKPQTVGSLSVSHLVTRNVHFFRAKLQTQEGIKWLWPDCESYTASLHSHHSQLTNQSINLFIAH